MATNNELLLHIWWLIAAMLVFMMQVGFLLLETGLIQERHQPGIAVKSMMMLLASSLAYTLFGYGLMWRHAPPTLLSSGEWQFYQTGFAVVAATILSGSMAGRTTLISNVIMAALVGGFFFPLHGRWVWGGGWLSKPDLHVIDFAGSGSVHLLGGLVALAGAMVAGPRREKLVPRPGEDIHISPRSLPIAACGVLFLWIGWMGFNGGSIQSSEDLPIVGRLLITTCLSASGGGLAVCMLAGAIRLARGESFVFAPYAALTGIMAGMVANSASCNLIAKSNQLGWSLVVGCIAGVFAYATNEVIQRIWNIDDPVEAIAVHAGGGIVGILSAGFLAEPRSLYPQIVDISVLVLFVFIPSWFVFKGMDVLGGFHIRNRTPIRLKSTSGEEIFGLIFDDPTHRIGMPLGRVPYLRRDLQDQVYEFMLLFVTTPLHVARNLLDSMRGLVEKLRAVAGDASELELKKLSSETDLLQELIDSAPQVLQRFRTGIGEPVPLFALLQPIVRQYQQRYDSVVDIKFASSPQADCVHGDRGLMAEAVRMVISNAVRACIDRSESDGGTRHIVTVAINWPSSMSPRHITVSVVDDGVGIDLAEIPYLGRPVSEFRPSRRGSGLGLFFAGYIAQAFGGQLDLVRARLLTPTRGISAARGDDVTEFQMRFRLDNCGDRS